MRWIRSLIALSAIAVPGCDPSEDPVDDEADVVPRGALDELNACQWRWNTVIPGGSRFAFVECSNGRYPVSGACWSKGDANIHRSHPYEWNIGNLPESGEDLESLGSPRGWACEFEHNDAEMWAQVYCCRHN